MAASSTSRPRARALRATVLGRLLCAVAVTVLAALAPAAAHAAVTPGVSAQSIANITDATTGISDASSLVVPRDACSAATPGQATCLAEYLALRGTRTPIRPNVRRAASPNRFVQRHAHSRRTSPLVTVPAAGTPQPGTPAYLQQAYDLAYLSQNEGAGQTVAIVDAYDDANAQADLSTYRSQFSLPPCTTGNGCFKKVDQTGGTNYPSPPSDPKVWNAWRLEISLDLAAVSALCPNCHIILVEAKSTSSTNMSMAHMTAKNLGATVISDSWRIVPGNQATQSALENAQFTFTGIPTVAASGDTGYLGVASDPDCAGLSPATLCNSYPAAQQDVTAVGGTTLAPTSGARGVSEAAWVWKNPATKDTTKDGATGSGCDTSQWATKPPWQTNTGCAGRAYNDVSANADPATGMLVYDSTYDSSPGWLVVGGTSQAAPLVAAYYALLQSATGGSLDVTTPEWLYGSPQAQLLNDPAGGTNGPCDPLSPVLCTAGSGWDGPTGAGSISGAVTTGGPGIGVPAIKGTDGAYSYTQSVTTNSALLQAGVYPNGDPTQYWWEYGTTTAYGQTTPKGPPVSGTNAVPVSTALTGLRPGTTYHYRLVASNTFGEMDGYDFTFTTAPAPPPVTTTPNPPAPPPPTTITKPPVTPARPASPSLGKLRVGALGGSTATVSAAIDPHGASTTFYLAYGTSPALGRRTPSGASARAGSASWNLRGLAAGRVYYLQVVATNAGGSGRTAIVRVRTSPVTLGRIAMHSGKLAVRVSCHGSGACRARLTARSGNRVIATGTANVRGNRTKTVLLHVNRAAATRASRGGKVQAIMSAVSVWNGYRATVTAKFRLALRS